MCVGVQLLAAAVCGCWRCSDRQLAPGGLCGAMRRCGRREPTPQAVALPRSSPSKRNLVQLLCCSCCAVAHEQQRHRVRTALAVGAPSCTAATAARLAAARKHCHAAAASPWPWGSGHGGAVRGGHPGTGRTELSLLSCKLSILQAPASHVSRRPAYKWTLPRAAQARSTSSRRGAHTAATPAAPERRERRPQQR